MKPQGMSMRELGEWAGDQRATGGNVFNAILAAAQARREKDTTALNQRLEARVALKDAVRRTAAGTGGRNGDREREVRQLLGEQTL